MTVYVGMDVHRKRSQVAVVDQAGAVQRNRNVPTTPPTSSRSLACSRPVPRLRSRPPTGRAGWSTCSTAWSSRRTWSIQLAASRSPRPGCRNDKVDAETLAQLLRADLRPRPGSHPHGSGPAGAATPPREPGAVDHQLAGTGSDAGASRVCQVTLARQPWGDAEGCAPRGTDLEAALSYPNGFPHPTGRTAPPDRRDPHARRRRLRLPGRRPPLPRARDGKQTWVEFLAGRFQEGR